MSEQKFKVGDRVRYNQHRGYRRKNTFIVRGITRRTQRTYDVLEGRYLTRDAWAYHSNRDYWASVYSGYEDTLEQVFLVDISQMDTKGVIERGEMTDVRMDEQGLVAVVNGSEYPLGPGKYVVKKARGR